MKHRHRIVAVAAITLVAALAAIPADAAGSRVWVVRAGQSIQAAVDRARPGDTILVEPGVFHESVLIQKNNIALRGSGSGGGGTFLKPPDKLPKSMCTKFTGGSGICVLPAKLGPQGAITQRVKGVTVSGFSVSGFPSFGVFAFGAKDLWFTDDTATDNGEYGLARFDSLGGGITDSRASGSGEAGIYVGDSQKADVKVSHNDVWDNNLGIFIRHTHGVTVSMNHGYNNCQGVLVLDDGQPEGAGDVTIKNNVLNQNNKACPGGQEGPPIQGGGIALIGATDSTVTSNIVKGNVGTEINSGGIVVISAADIAQGKDPANDTITDNTLSGNSPADVHWDSSGTGNTFKGNNCTTSDPTGLC